jgi:hypothetical protein
MISQLHQCVPDSTRPFQFLEDDELVDLLESKLQGSATIRKLIIEASVREVDPELMTVVLDRYLHCALDELFQRYSKLSKLFFAEPPHEFFFPDAKNYLTQAESTTAGEGDREPQWPWEIAAAENTRTNRRGLPYFDNEHSALWVCGYRVGERGMQEPERHRFLAYFFRNPLPAVVAKQYGSDYGSPKSMARLRKMAHVLAAHCRNFGGRRNASQYRKAISEWESDLQFLKTSFYNSQSFAWPECRGGN